MSTAVIHAIMPSILLFQSLTCVWHCVLGSSLSHASQSCLTTAAGTLPHEWGNITYSLLDLSDNQLSGTVPAAWLTTVYGSPVVRLARSRLRGPLPAAFSSTDGLLGGQPSRLQELALA